MIIDGPISIFPVTEGLIFKSRPTAKCKLLGEKSCPVTKFGCCACFSAEKYRGDSDGLFKRMDM